MIFLSYEKMHFSYVKSKICHSCCSCLLRAAAACAALASHSAVTVLHNVLWPRQAWAERTVKQRGAELWRLRNSGVRQYVHERARAYGSAHVNWRIGPCLWLRKYCWRVNTGWWYMSATVWLQQSECLDEFNGRISAWAEWMLWYECCGSVPRAYSME